MTSPVSTSTYDCIFMGTGIICVLEAIYQNRLGKSVLMIDQQSDIGGAWIPLELFGLQDVENAVHYFLDDAVAFDFMKTVLKWNVIPSPQKYRVFPKAFWGIHRLPFNSFWGRCLSNYFESVAQSTVQHSLQLFLQAVAKTIKEPQRNSHYVAGGTPEMVKKTKELLRSANIDIRLSEKIERIRMEPMSDVVEVVTSKNVYSGKTLYITHGAQISDLYQSDQKVPVKEEFHWRPQVHLLIQDDSSSEVLESIFIADPLIKYSHDITRFAKGEESPKQSHKIFAVALHSHYQEDPKIYDQIVERLKQAQLIGPGAVLKDACWWKIHLPLLDDGQLEQLEQQFSPRIATLKTENFAVGVGLYAKRWATQFEG